MSAPEAELRTLLRQTLLDAQMLIDDARFDRTRLDAAATSKRHLRGALHGIGSEDPAIIARSVGLSTGAMARVFGHGWQQAAGFAALAGVRPHRVEAVARLGALLSLGIVLFDHVIDTFPSRRAFLLERVTPELFGLATETAIARSASAAERSGDAGIDFLAGLAAELVSGARRLEGRPEDAERLTGVLGEMYRGELASAEARRTDARLPPSAQVWEALRRKSALPSVAVAVLALLANPGADDAARGVVETAAACTGEAFWIADDLADVRSDWDAGCWSRPLWLLLRAPGDPPVSAEDAIERLLRSGIATTEAQQLCHVLVQLTEIPGVSDRSLVRPVQAAVRSWLEEIPVS